MIKTITHSSAKLAGTEEVVVVPLFDEKTLPEAVRKVDSQCRSAISKTLANGTFKKDRGKTMLLAVNVPKAPKLLMLLGMGKRSDANPERMAICGGAASRDLKALSVKSCHLIAIDDDTLTEHFESFLKGFLLAQYDFKISSQKQATGPTKLTILAGKDNGTAAAARSARVVADYTCKVRDLVNTPADAMVPARLAQEAKSLAVELGFQCKILSLRDLERMKMGAVLAVAKGSRAEPKFIVLHYNGNQRGGLPRVCLVGKGVTFDTGGISIKPWMNMNEMKGDMAGAAVVISSVAAAARLKLPIEIIGLVPSVENMPDGIAFRPGDIITTYAGKTIEVLSTDAEGRLILSDALAYGAEMKPDVIVDYATLTGAVVIALGNRIAGIMGNSQKHMDRFIAAGLAAGEPVWQLPLDDVYIEQVRGDISDYKNYAGREGSTITAAALLHEFVDDIPWVHLDIAGTFWANSAQVPYNPKGATGYGVDLTLRYLKSLVE